MLEFCDFVSFLLVLGDGIFGELDGFLEILFYCLSGEEGGSSLPLFWHLFCHLSLLMTRYFFIALHLYTPQLVVNCL